MVSPGRGTTRVTGPSMSVDHNAFRNDNAEVSFLELLSSRLFSIISKMPWLRFPYQQSAPVDLSSESETCRRARFRRIEFQTLSLIERSLFVITGILYSNWDLWYGRGLVLNKG